ncbi:MAG: glycosyltransferase family 39 protein [Archangiaceae bacterium]|nr:glycosyltransferase family 39 protein [Archangiaceae bacterium]
MNFVRRHRAALEAAGIAALVFLPFLGSVGLWDPWETNYAEAAREMIARGDLIHPYWESGWFFSKPILALWLMVPGLWLTGAAGPGGELSLYTEWLVRLPFALLAIAAVAMFSDAVARASSPRAGRLTAVALSTMPMFFFVARQAMTDMAYVAPFTLCMAGAIRALLVETDPRARDRQWYRAFAWSGVATLGKGMLGFGLPGLVLAAFLASQWPRSKQTWREIPWVDGLLLWAVIALPWYLAMFGFSGRDAEGYDFFQRFIVHDHLERLGRGVHSPTAGGNFTYFVEQLGFGLFPWVALVPAAFASAMVRRGAPLQTLLLLWAVLSFGLFSASATRYHHYILPMLPAVAALIGLARPRPLGLLAGAVLLGLVTRDLAGHPKYLVDLFTYNHDRAYPDFLWTRAMGIGLAVGAGACVAALAWRRLPAPLTVGAFALVLAVFFSSVHWVQLSHHWTQRDLFWRYWRQAAPGEPIAAFWMDWKGETFYSRNQVVQVKPGKESLALELARRPGRAWFLVEPFRLQALRQTLGASQQLALVEPSLNDKFVLVVASDVGLSAR